MLESNQIYQMDCLEGLQQLPDQSVNLIITSPPYAERRKDTYGGIHSKEYVSWFLPIAQQLYRVLANDGSFFLNIKPHCVDGERDLYVFHLVMALKEMGWRFVDEFTWTKNAVPGKFTGRFKNAFEPVYHFSKSKQFTFRPYDVASPMKEESKKRSLRKKSNGTQNGSGFAGLRENSRMSEQEFSLPSNHLHFVQKSNQYTEQSKHPAVFPVDLPLFFIKAFSNENDLVLDPFMGSGTTAVASIQSGRRYIGFEKNPMYFPVIEKRIR